MGAGGVPGGAGGGGELSTAGGDRVTCLAAATPGKTKSMCVHQMGNIR